MRKSKKNQEESSSGAGSDALEVAYNGARAAIDAATSGKPGPAALADKSVREDLSAAVSALENLATGIAPSAPKKKCKGKKLVKLAILGGIAAVVLSEDVRKKVLDAAFGAEEEFEYSSTTAP